jgi:antitoxin component YwqK of YwqJK toxin-antitoxin module
MRSIIVLLINLFFISILIAQNDTVFNQTDEQGLKQGYWKKSYNNGNLMYKGFFKDNKPLGKMIRYYESGGLQAILEFRNDIESTQAKLYYEDGEISAEGNYINTLKDSLWKYYSFWTGALVSEEYYIKGKKNGVQKSYYANGNVSEETEYKNDIKDGHWIQYFEDGKKKLEATYRWNKVNGRYTLYYPTGNVYILGNFDENKRHGTWTFYDEEGNEKYKLRYNLGTLNEEDKEQIEEKDTEFFKMVDENVGKFEEPSIENFYNTGPM